MNKVPFEESDMLDQKSNRRTSPLQKATAGKKIFNSRCSLAFWDTIGCEMGCLTIKGTHDFSSISLSNANCEKVTSASGGLC